MLAITYSVDITVVLCTYQRCESLAKALLSVAASELPASLSWEVLIVDNNSSDRTRAVAEQFCLLYPSKIRYIFEPRPGKSHGLNTAIEVARGDILAFMDDDVQVQASWLRNLTAPILNRECVGSGGRIIPPGTFVRPRWLSDQPTMLAPLAMFDLGSTQARLKEPPFGTNMAFQRIMFDKYGRFRTDLGPRPGSYIRAEDTEFGTRLLAGGETLLYVPDAVVTHPVPPQRLRKKYFLRWWFDKGRTDIREAGGPGKAVRISGVPIVFLRRLLVCAAKWMVSYNPARRFQRKIGVWSECGEIVECYRSSRITPHSSSECLDTGAGYPTSL